MSTDSPKFVSVQLSPEARGELRQATLDLTSPVGRRLSMSAVLIQAIHVACRHRGELVAALTGEPAPVKETVR